MASLWWNHEAIGLLSRALAVYRFLDDEEGQWSCLKATGLARSHTGEAVQALETHPLANSFKRQDLFLQNANWLRWFSSTDTSYDPGRP